MFETVYETLANFGYTHPLHPMVTHLPVGLVIGGTLFGLLAVLSGSSSLATTARHCMTLAFFALIPTVVLGYSDWQHFYAGAWLFPIKAKMVLTGALGVFLLLAIMINRPGSDRSGNYLPMYILCLATVICIGYFGGELVFGKGRASGTADTDTPGADVELARQGEALFSQSCAFCHFADKPDTKAGPGLKGIFGLARLPASGRPLSRENIEKQFKMPYKDMPAFEQLSREEIDALVAYLRTL